MGEFEDLQQLANQIQNGELYRVRLKIPRWAKHVGFNKIFQALSTTFSFDKSIHCASSTRACQNVNGPAVANFFILDLKSEAMYKKMIEAKTLKIQEQTTAHIFQILPKADTSSSNIRDNPVTVTISGVDPILAVSKIIEVEISKYCSFDPHKAVSRSIFTGTMSIIVDEVRALLPLALSFISKAGLVHEVTIKVENYKPQHIELGSLPLETSLVPLNNDWKLFQESDIIQKTVAPRYCTYCKAAGHVNTASSPCPLSVARNANTLCGICKKRGHPDHLCSVKNVCRACGSEAHPTEDIKTCSELTKKQYYPIESDRIRYPNHPLVAKYKTFLEKTRSSRARNALSLDNFQALPSTQGAQAPIVASTVPSSSAAVFSTSNLAPSPAVNLQSAQSSISHQVPPVSSCTESDFSSTDIIVTSTSRKIPSSSTTQYL